MSNLVITSDAVKIVVDFGVYALAPDEIFPKKGTFNKSDILEIFSWSDKVEILTLSGGRYDLKVDPLSTTVALSVDTINDIVPTDLLHLHSLLEDLML